MDKDNIKKREDKGHKTDKAGRKEEHKEVEIKARKETRMRGTLKLQGLK
jgi:hypothetical protein